MYNRIKNLLIKLIPRKVLFKYEYHLRFFYYLFSKGNKYHCTICEKDLRKFIRSDDDQLCPRCGSISRTRRLWTILDTEFLNNELSILDFSPSRSIYRLFKKKKFNYLSSDLSGDFISDVSFDITSIESPDKSFDLIICYHVLEHIENDIQAMKELYRVLKSGGHCIIQTPFKEGEIFEDTSVQTAKDRLIHFGQEDHVRIYSANGLKERLEKAGFETEIRIFKEKVDNVNGYKCEETVLICSK